MIHPTSAMTNLFRGTGRLPPSAPRSRGPMQRLLRALENRFPRILARLDRERIGDGTWMRKHCEAMASLRGHSDFDQNSRGQAYRDGQKKVPFARERGERKIWEVLADSPRGLSGRSVGLDVIGGNGTTARVAGGILPLDRTPLVVAGDPCADMVEDALRQNLPAVWQSAQSTLFAPGSLDFVLGSRGFHHIDVASRPAVAAEAFRVLAPGGRVLFIDFEEGTPSARWYSEALDRFTNTGHRFAHFTRVGFKAMLDDAGFQHTKVFDLYDPFVFRAQTRQEASRALLGHLVSMFGMVKLTRRADEAEAAYWEALEATLSPYATFAPREVAFEDDARNSFVTFSDAPNVYRSEFPRVALCVTGVKPGVD